MNIVSSQLTRCAILGAIMAFIGAYGTIYGADSDSLGFYTDRIEFKADPSAVSLSGGIKNVYFIDPVPGEPMPTSVGDAVSGADVDGIGYVPASELDFDNIVIDPLILTVLLENNIGSLGRRIRNVPEGYTATALNPDGEIYEVDPSQFFVAAICQNRGGSIEALETLKAALESASPMGLQVYYSCFPIPQELGPAPQCTGFAVRDQLSDFQWYLDHLPGINVRAMHDILCAYLTNGRTVAIIDGGYGPEPYGHEDIRSNLHPRSELNPFDVDPGEVLNGGRIHGLWVAGMVSAAAANLPRAEAFFRIGVGWGIYSASPYSPLLCLDYSDSTDFIEDYWTLIQLEQSGEVDADIVNTSWTLTQSTYPPIVGVIQVLAFDGVMQFGAAGDHAATSGDHEALPACHPFVCSIGATTPELTIAEFSNRNNHTYLAAPGADIITTGWDCVGKPCDPYTADAFSYHDGTSFSSPLVAGAAAGLWSARPDLSGYTIAQIIAMTTEEQTLYGSFTGPYDELWYDSAWGHGLPDMAAAARMLLTGPPWGEAPFYGDANGDHYLNLADALCIIRWIYQNGPPPDLVYGDANCDGSVRSDDAVYIIYYLYHGGPPPCGGSGAMSADGGNPYALMNSPNPFNARSTIRFNLPVASHVRLEIFNIIGQKVATLVDGYHDVGAYSYDWDAENVASGVYLYRLTTDEFTQTKKMILMK